MLASMGYAMWVCLNVILKRLPGSLTPRRMIELFRSIQRAPSASVRET